MRVIDTLRKPVPKKVANILVAAAALGILLLAAPYSYIIAKSFGIDAARAEANQKVFMCDQFPSREEADGIYRAHLSEIETLKKDARGKIDIILWPLDHEGSRPCLGRSELLVRFDRVGQIKTIKTHLPDDVFHGIPIRYASYW